MIIEVNTSGQIEWWENQQNYQRRLKSKPTFPLIEIRQKAFIKFKIIGKYYNQNKTQLKIRPIYVELLTKEHIQF